MKKNFPYKDPKLSVSARTSDLLSRMTLEEKVDQLIQITIGQDTNPNNISATKKFKPTYGSVLSFSRSVAERNEFQRIAVEKTRLGIPIIWGFDVIHGWKTAFAIPLAQASAWNPNLIEKACRIAAEESSNAGVDWTFAPMVDVPHDPRWGRVAEGFGEDPYAAGVCARAAVRGFQTKNPSKQNAIAACLKHYVGYAAVEGGRDYNYSDISMRRLHDTYLIPFHAGVDEGALTLMSSFNDITGVPAVANHYTLTDVLRGKWRFKGFVVSDWDGVGQLGNQGLADEPAVKAIKALSAGNDMDMISGCYKTLIESVRKGLISENVIDTAVARILTVKFKLGLFEHPYTEQKPEKEVCLLPESLELSRQIAREAAVLLKNEKHTLPLSRKTESIALIGPAAEDPEAMVGCWYGMTDFKTVPVIKDTLKKSFPKTKIFYAKGCDFKSDDESGFAEALKVAKKASVIVAALGEFGGRAGENASWSNIHLPGKQAELLKKLSGLGKPVVLVVASGRPIIYENLEPYADAILHIWQGGHGTAEACGDILCGDWNPCGRLPITFPRTEAQIPIYYNRNNRSRLNQGNYHDLPDSPMYDFGYGLSYTECKYGKITMNKALQAEVPVTNAGKTACIETVFLYLTDPVAELTQPVKRLIAFARLNLEPGEKKTMVFQLDPMRDFAYINETGKKVLESGRLILSSSSGTPFEFKFDAEKKKVVK